MSYEDNLNLPLQQTKEINNAGLKKKYTSEGCMSAWTMLLDARIFIFNNNDNIVLIKTEQIGHQRK